MGETSGRTSGRFERTNGQAGGQGGGAGRDESRSGSARAIAWKHWPQCGLGGGAMVRGAFCTWLEDAEHHDRHVVARFHPVEESLHPVQKALGGLACRQAFGKRADELDETLLAEQLAAFVRRLVETVRVEDESVPGLERDLTLLELRRLHDSHHGPAALERQALPTPTENHRLVVASVRE